MWKKMEAAAAGDDKFNIKGQLKYLGTAEDYAVRRCIEQRVVLSNSVLELNNRIACYQTKIVKNEALLATLVSTETRADEIISKMKNDPEFLGMSQVAESIIARLSNSSKIQKTPGVVLLFDQISKTPELVFATEKELNHTIYAIAEQIHDRLVDERWAFREAAEKVKIPAKPKDSRKEIESTRCVCPVCRRPTPHPGPCSRQCRTGYLIATKG
jgi:hypothetical protein